MKCDCNFSHYEFLNLLFFGNCAFDSFCSHNMFKEDIVTGTV